MEITLKNCMLHPQFSFPESMVSYQMSFSQPVDERTVCVMSEHTVKPAQISQRVYCGNQLQSAKISFTTDLPCGATKHFRICTQEHPQPTLIACANKDGWLLSNGKLSIHIGGASEVLFTIQQGVCVGQAVLNTPVREKKIELLENGPIFAKVMVSVHFKNGDTYIQKIEMTACDPYIILDESMDADNSGAMQLIWKNLDPIYRVQKSGVNENRATGPLFKADEYTEDDGLLRQTRLTPYDESSGMAGTHFMSFVGPELAAGVFCTDFHRWWDGSYAIDGYHYGFLPKFYCKYRDDECDLRFHYPLICGSRQTAITIYPADLENRQGISYVESLFYYGAKIPLNLFKDWVLEWPHDKTQYPRFFDLKSIDPKLRYGFVDGVNGLPTPEQMLQRIFNSEYYRYPSSLAIRLFESWTPAFDLLAPQMSEEQFKQWSAIMAFYAYANCREETFPIDNMLAGHPNFLLDAKNCVGICAALFPEHPAAQQWKRHYEKSVALLLKYHIRPDVDAWKAKGGRYTESYGTYAWGSMKHASQAAMLLTLQYGDDPLLYPQLAKLGNWLVNAVTVPIAGRRTFLYTGAHAGCHDNNPLYPLWSIRALGLALRRYDPQLSDQLLALCPPEPAIGHEIVSDSKDADVWLQCLKRFPEWQAHGAEQILRSTKYTGYGFNLRAHVGQEDEIHVFLQQLDEGLNYRWGRAAWGGCGNIYYHADGKRYSGNRHEDFGDDNFGDSDVGCNFCVLMDHTYKSVGQNDLTHPLLDFEFVQYARLDAGSYSSDEYRYRSVMLVDNRYIVIYDAVRDARTEGRFVWNNFEDEPMPLIHQLRPGAKPRTVRGPALTVDGIPRLPAVCEDKDTRGVVYDGYGDFLTVVTHRAGIEAYVCPYGAVVTEHNKKEYIFNANYFGKYSEDGVYFSGRVGFARKKDGYIELAVIDGVSIGMDDFHVTRVSGDGAFSLCIRKDGITGIAETPQQLCLRLTVPKAYRAYQNGKECFMENGTLTVTSGAFQLTSGLPVPGCIKELSYVETPEGIRLQFLQACFAESYQVQTGQAIFDCRSGELIPQLHDGEIIAVRAVNAQGCGPWSQRVALHMQCDVPLPPDGLRVFARKNGYEICWGKVSGVSGYRLYRMKAGERKCIWEGTQCTFFDNDTSDLAEYRVSSINGYGEGALSQGRDTSVDGLAHFDPMPNVPYVRDTIVNLHGYGGFDYRYNENRRIYQYPDNTYRNDTTKGT